MSQMSQHATAGGFYEWPRWKVITAWVLQVLAGVAFLASGVTKLIGLEMQVETFEKIGAAIGTGPWFRYLTGVLEIVGGFLILIPRTAFWGALLLVGVMVGAIFTHLALIGGSPVPAIILLVVTATVAWLRRP